MSAVLKDLEQADSIDRMSDEALWQRYCSPEAREHFKVRYPAKCWESEDYE